MYDRPPLDLWISSLMPSTRYNIRLRLAQAAGLTDFLDSVQYRSLVVLSTVAD